MVSSLLIMAAPPAAAVTVLSGCSDICGSWSVVDTRHEKGVRCLYGAGLYGEIYKISVRPPVMFGHGTLASTVGWRFRIQSRHTNGGPFVTDYTSKYQTAQASLSVAAQAGHGFSRRSWAVPANTGYNDRRVIVDMQWWKQQLVQGHVKVLYDAYAAKNDDGGGSIYILDRCFAHWFEY